jgi:hypothetical protein
MEIIGWVLLLTIGWAVAFALGFGLVYGAMRFFNFLKH